MCFAEPYSERGDPTIIAAKIVILRMVVTFMNITGNGKKEQLR
jgi:hypothetical protein